MTDDTKKLRIRKFVMDNLKPKKTILLVGKRGTGKSTLLKDILYHIRKRVDTGFAMSPTFDTIQMFEECLPRSHIYNDYDIDVVRNLINCLQSLKEQNKERNIVLSTDDCMFNKSIMKSNEMRQIHMNGRHFNIWYINSVQYVMDLGPDIRTQIDYVFCLKENVIANRKRLHDYFFGVCNSLREFSLIMDKCTNDHECLVLDNTQKSNDINEMIYYYKADPNIGRFRVGKSIYFKLDHYFRKSNLQETQSSNPNAKLKLPEPVKSKLKIEQVEKQDPSETEHKEESKVNSDSHGARPSVNPGEMRSEPAGHENHNHRRRKVGHA